MKRFLAAFFLALTLIGCGGQNTSNTPPEAAFVPPKFPAFTSVRSDFIDTFEGTAWRPLRIAEPPCTILPYIDWQTWLCTKTATVPSVYATSNGFSYTSDPYNSWIIVANNEWIQLLDECNNGPPNQSRTFNKDVFFFNPTPAFLEFSTLVRGNNCNRLPYMSASYTRGTQEGDTLTKLMSWSDLQKVKLNVNFDHQRDHDKFAWQQLYVHFKDPKTGIRYMVLQEIVTPDTYPTIVVNWNWPFKASFQYPGAKIGFVAVTPADSVKNGNHEISWDLAKMALVPFPEFKDIQPDFLGVEFGIESSEDQRILVRLNKVEFK